MCTSPHLTFWPWRTRTLESRTQCSNSGPATPRTPQSSWTSSGVGRSESWSCSWRLYSWASSAGSAGQSDPWTACRPGSAARCQQIRSARLFLCFRWHCAVCAPSAPHCSRRSLRPLPSRLRQCRFLSPEKKWSI